MNLGNLTEDQRRQLDELLSASSIGSMGGQGYLNGQQNGRLSDLMNPQPQSMNQSGFMEQRPLSPEQRAAWENSPAGRIMTEVMSRQQQQPMPQQRQMPMPMSDEPYMPPQQMPMPQNYIRNERTGATYDMGQSQQQSGPALDYSSPIEIGGYGKGYRIKGDASRVVLSDGRIVRMGADTGADQKRMAADLQTQMTRQKLAEGEIDQQIKRAQLNELLGIDPAQGGGMMTQFPTETPPFSGNQPQMQGVNGAQQQVSVPNQKMLTRRFGNAPEGTRWDAQGNAVKVPGYEKPLTEFQGKSANFGGRAAAAHEIINTIGDGGNVQPGTIKRVLQATPFIGEGLGTLANITQSAPQQQVEQAQRDFVNAVLRQESGAAIAESEFTNAQKQYFPQPGDTPDVILQKKRNREQAIAGFAVSAGDGGKKLITSSREKTQAIFEAHKAIKEGKDRAAVKQRLESYGITDHGIK